MKKLIAPSLLSADFSKLEKEIAEVEAAGADWLHVDVMDGHFVPNLTIGPVVVQSLKPVTKLPLDCHLMVTHPEKWIPGFVKAGAHVITIHLESDGDVKENLKLIRKSGCLAGISLNPDTPTSRLNPYLDDIDLVLVMSVFPGFGGQKYISESEKRVEEIVKLRGSRKFLIEIDGGITRDHIAPLAKSGVDVFVAGSAIFGNRDRKKAVAEMKEKL